jgi:hypothetical protein
MKKKEGEFDPARFRFFTPEPGLDEAIAHAHLINASDTIVK